MTFSTLPKKIGVSFYSHPFFRYGNNAVEMETTAVYDSSTQEFIIDTPTPLAQKYWITNGATHAKHVVVFAQLNVDGMCVYSWFPNCTGPPSSWHLVISGMLMMENYGNYGEIMEKSQEITGNHGKITGYCRKP